MSFRLARAIAPGWRASQRRSCPFIERDCCPSCTATWFALRSYCAAGFVFDRPGPEIGDSGSYVARWVRPFDVLAPPFKYPSRLAAYKPRQIGVDTDGAVEIKPAPLRGLLSEMALSIGEKHFREPAPLHLRSQCRSLEALRRAERFYETNSSMPLNSLFQLPASVLSL